MRGICLVAAIALSVAAPNRAAAQSARPSWFVSPFVGVSAGAHDTTATAAVTGVSAGWNRAWLGVEASVAHAPYFLEQDSFRTSRSVLTFMTDALVRIPVERHVRPYVTGGIGVLRLRLGEAGGFRDLDVTQPAFDAGAGIAAMWNRIGLRTDVRYVRSLGDAADDANPFGVDVSTLGFWRTTTGVVVEF